MAKKFNAKKEKRARNAAYAAMIKAKVEEKKRLKKALEKERERERARQARRPPPPVRVTLLPEERHGQAVPAP